MVVEVVAAAVILVPLATDRSTPPVRYIGIHGGRTGHDKYELGDSTSTP